MATADRLERWEYLPAAALFVAAGLNTGLWYIGPLMPDAVRAALPWLVTIVGIVAILAIDGSLIATIAGMRQGRRSNWSKANIFVTALFTALAALSAHDVLLQIGPALHALFAATIVTYAMHLAQPRADVGIALALREQELDSRELDLDERLHDVTQQKLLIDGRLAMTDKIIELRDKDKLSFAEIGKQLDITRQAAWQQYKSAKGE